MVKNVRRRDRQCVEVDASARARWIRDRATSSLNRLNFFYSFKSIARASMADWQASVVGSEFVRPETNHSCGNKMDISGARKTLIFTYLPLINEAREERYSPD